MIRLFLTLMFSFLALAGFGLILYGITLKPTRNNEDTGGGGDEILLEFSGAREDGPEIIDLERGPDSMDLDEKKHFDPVKHRPEKIVLKKADEES
jgi:hypothetical protein